MDIHNINTASHNPIWVRFDFNTLSHKLAITNLLLIFSGKRFRNFEESPSEMQEDIVIVSGVLAADAVCRQHG